MVIGDVRAVDGVPGLHYVDTGMFDAPNYGSVYLLDTARPALVDSGIGAECDRVAAACEAVGIEPEAILLTHVHLDHAGGAGALADRYGATVYVHERGAHHLVDPDRLVAGTKAAVGDAWRHYADPVPIPEARVESVTDGDAVDLGDRTLVAHAAPGHAPHQVVYHDPTVDAVFTGDAAGIHVPTSGRVVETTPPPDFDLEGCLTDLETLRELRPETLLYGHFGPASVPGAGDDPLDAYADRLRDWVDRADRALDATGGDPAAAADRIDPHPDTVAAWGEPKARSEIELNVRGVAAFRGRP